MTEVEPKSIIELNKEFSVKNALRIKQFQEQNPGKKLPVYKNKAGLYYWANRKQRRAMRK